MRPVIGITCSRSVSVADPQGGRVYHNSVLGFDYVQAVQHAGGLPVALPTLADADCFEEYLDAIDGLLLSGGMDVDPLLYGEDPHPLLGGVDIERDRMEIALARQAFERALPMLAICRGIQVLNVAFGGTLYQDVSQHGSQVLKHRQNAPKWHGTHPIQIEPDSLLAAIAGSSEWLVNSFHHQAVKEVAPGFLPTAHSRDGLIEAIESETHSFVLGVQCHPEMMWQADPNAARLFQRFVQACSEP